MKNRWIALLTIVVLAAFSMTLSAATRGPISILGDRDFTEANGVVSGTGTVDDPYMITGWEILVPSDAAYGVKIENTSAAFVLRGVIIQGGAQTMGAAIRIGFAEQGTIEDCTIGGAVNGIEISSSTHLTIRRTVISVTGRGLRVTGDTPAEYQHDVSDDVFYNDYPIAYYYGLDGETIEGLRTGHLTVADSRNVTVKDNEVVSGDGISFAFVEDSVITGNASYRAAQVYTDHGIHLYRSHGNLIDNNSLRNNRLAGIQLALSDRNTLEANQLLANDSGIRLVASDENLIKANIVFANPGGISITGGSSANEIVENIIYHENTSQGILLASGTANLVARNGISDCEFGIVVEGPAVNNQIVANTILSGQYGISMTGSLNRIEDNLIAQQGRGLLFPETYSREQQTENEILGNVFTDNGQHVYLNLDSSSNVLSGNAFFGAGIERVADQGTGNAWTKDGIGNYWGGSPLTDADGDGYGDGPVTVYSSGQQDTAPLMAVDPLTAGVGILSTLERGTVVLEQPDEATIEIPALLAREGYERWVGFRGFPEDLLVDFGGILFVFETEEARRFTMETVLFDLDIAFFDAAGGLVGHATMDANSDELYTASGPFQYALELAPGTLDSLDLDAASTLVVP